MAVPALSDLLTVPDVNTVLNTEVLSGETSQGAAVTSWAVGDPWRTLAYLIATMRQSVRLAVATLAAAGFEDYAFGFSSVTNPFTGTAYDLSAWAPLIAKQRYGVNQIAASYTKRKITLTNTSNAPYSPTAGNILLLFSASGNRYILDENGAQAGGVGITIPANGSTTAIFRSENYSTIGTTYNTDGPGATIQLVTANYPGVTATNPAPAFSAVSQVGSGVGTVTPSGALAAGGATILVKIFTTGTVGGATVDWRTSTDGVTWTDHGAAASANLGNGVTVTLADAGGAPAFINGTVYSFNAGTSVTDITQVGRDAETPQALGTRCRGLWPSLAFQRDANNLPIPLSPTMGAYEALVRSASSQVVTVRVATDGTVNNQIDIYVAGQGALLPASTTSAIQSFLNSYNMITDSPVILSPSTLVITLAAATIKVKAALAASAPAALTNAINLYTSGADPNNPLPIGGLMDRSYVLMLIRQAAGVTHVDDALTINGAATDLQLGASQLATLTNFNAATAFTWVPA